AFSVGRELAFAGIFLIPPQHEGTDFELSFDDLLIVPYSYFLF
ncbi:hypothetical protein A2U01_0083919, partial [Trifolium medium]|nr:hypothetical protein [Trifolium medium]